MVYKRKAGKTWTMQARTRDGWQQLSTGCTTRSAALRVAALWERLAREHRAWDLLEAVLQGRLRIGQLADLAEATREDVVAMRARLRDVPLAAHVEPWLAAYGTTVAPDSARHAEVHVRWLVAREPERLTTQADAAWLAAQLAAYPATQSTRRKVHSSWSAFFRWLVLSDQISTNPMDRVPRPALPPRPIAFFELAQVERLVHAQPTQERRALFALAYGSGIDASVLVKLRREDVDPERREVRAAGTKSRSRDRVARVADWAWPLVWAHARTVLPGGDLWPGASRWTVSDWHRATVRELGLSPALPLRCARHHWAVRMVRAGTPLAVVAAQLGHGSVDLVLRVYGRFAPSGVDRDRWEAAAAESERRSAEGSAGTTTARDAIA